VVLFEPTRDDADMFFTNVFSYRGRSRLCEHAYQRTRKDLYQRRHELRPIFERHGIHLESRGAQGSHALACCHASAAPIWRPAPARWIRPWPIWRLWLQAQEG
jgi:hypothetical protein